MYRWERSNAHRPRPRARNRRHTLLCHRPLKLSTVSLECRFVRGSKDGQRRRGPNTLGACVPYTSGVLSGPAKRGSSSNCANPARPTARQCSMRHGTTRSAVHGQRRPSATGKARVHRRSSGSTSPSGPCAIRQPLDEVHLLRSPRARPLRPSVPAARGGRCAAVDIGHPGACAFANRANRPHRGDRVRPLLTQRPANRRRTFLAQVPRHTSASAAASMHPLLRWPACVRVGESLGPSHLFVRLPHDSHLAAPTRCDPLVAPSVTPRATNAPPRASGPRLAAAATSRHRSFSAPFASSHMRLSRQR